MGNLFLETFDLLEFIKNYWLTILIVIGSIIALIFIIIFVWKHKVFTVFFILLVAVAGVLVFCNLKFAATFTEEMTCKTIDFHYSEDDYVKYEIGDISVYQKKNIEDDKLINISTDIFAVKKTLFYFSEVEAKVAEVKKDGEATDIKIKYFKANGSEEKYVYQIVPDYNKFDSIVGTITLDSIKVDSVDINSDQLFIFQTDQKIESFTYLLQTFTVEYK